MNIPTPDRTEADAYYFTYIDKVPRDTDIVRHLEAQLDETTALLNGVADEKSLHRYAPGKWSIRESMSHVNDTERVFTFRAMWFARGFNIPLPSFDQDIGVAGSSADTRAWRSHIDEFRAIRGATIQLFRNMPDEAWSRRGVASGMEFTVRALSYITAGHVAHHLGILRERYL
jgi:hypothetical protein